MALGSRQGRSSSGTKGLSARSAPGRASASTGGFTLMETLVAIGVLAVAMVVILQLFSGGLRASKLSGDYTDGVFRAKEIMEEALLPVDLSEGVREGRFDNGYRWRSEVVFLTPLDEDDREQQKELPFDLYRVTVTVWWSSGEKNKRFELSTLKLAKHKEG